MSLYSNWKRRTQRIDSNRKNTYTSGVFQKTNIKENMKRPPNSLIKEICQIHCLWDEREKPCSAIISRAESVIRCSVCRCIRQEGLMNLGLQWEYSSIKYTCRPMLDDAETNNWFTYFTSKASWPGNFHFLPKKKNTAATSRTERCCKLIQRVRPPLFAPCLLMTTCCLTVECRRKVRCPILCREQKEISFWASHMYVCV